MTLHDSHSIVCRAPAADVYELVSHSSCWPQVLARCEAVTILEARPDYELVEIAAWIHGRIARWQTERRRLPGIRGVDTRMVRTMPLVAAMRTSWRVLELDAESSVLLLEHEYELEADVAGKVPGVATADDAEKYISSAIDANATQELADFKAAAEGGVPERSRRDPSAEEGRP